MDHGDVEEDKEKEPRRLMHFLVVLGSPAITFGGENWQISITNRGEQPIL